MREDRICNVALPRIFVLSLTLARGFVNDCGNSQKENQNIEVIRVMHSLGVSRCAGDIGKSSVNSMKMCVCGIGKRSVF